MCARRASSDNPALAGPKITFEILQALAGSAEDGKGVTELAEQLGTSKARIYRYLQTLVALGYATQDEKSDRYQAGIELFLLGQRVLSRFTFLTAVRPELSRLRDKFGQSVTASRIVGTEVVIVDAEPGHPPLQMVPQVGHKYDCHVAAHGKVALAFDEQLAQAVLRKPLRAWTPSTETNVKRIKSELALIRKRGWASAPNQSVIGINALAAPIFNRRGQHVGGIAMIGSIQFIPVEPEARQVDALKGAAEAASRRLGWDGKMLDTSTGDRS